MKALAEAALEVLERNGLQEVDGEWSYRSRTRQGTSFDIACHGTSLPRRVPDRLVSPTEIPKDRAWQATWRLAVKAPLIVLDLAWQADAPLRIMVFSRGDWEEQLLAAGQE